MHKHFKDVAGDILGVPNVSNMQQLMGSEDFAFYQEVIPGYIYFLGMKNETKDKVASAHSPFFEVNEDILPFGAALHAALASRYLLEVRELETPLVNGNQNDEL